MERIVPKHNNNVWKRHCNITLVYIFNCELTGGNSVDPSKKFPQCIRQISHNVPFCNRNLHTCAHFCCKMVHWGYGTGALWNLLTHWSYHSASYIRDFTVYCIHSAGVLWNNALELKSSNDAHQFSHDRIDKGWGLLKLVRQSHLWGYITFTQHPLLS